MSIVNPPPSPSDQDAIHYPCSDGQPMGETEIHVLAIFHLYHALHVALPEADFIAADMFWYWEQGHPESVVAPDLMVVKARGRGLRRRSFFTWREGGTIPCVVFEMASEGTWREDLNEKRLLYERLGVREYFLFDPEGAYLPSQWVGYRLVGGHYAPIERDRDGRLTSQELGLLMGAEGSIPRLFDATTGAVVPTPEERAEHEALLAEQAQQRAEQERQLAEQERQQAEQERQRAEQERNRAEQERNRADALEAEVERLKALLGQAQATAGGGPSE
jgi:Uma2 family endonuclease